MKQRMLVRGGLLLALGLVAQQLRIFIPLPTLLMTLVIGTLLNCVLVIAARHINMTVALLLALALPVMAFLQGHLPLPLLIPVIFLGNAVLVALCNRWWVKPIFVLAPIAKTCTLYGVGTLLFMEFGTQDTLVTAVLFGLGWPQLLTAIWGILLERYLEKRIF